MEVDKVIDRIGISRTHKWMVFILCSLEILNGFQIVIISLIAPYLKKHWSLNDDVEDIPLSLYFGIIVGSFAAGSMANQLGRKPTLLIGLLVQIVNSILLTISSQFFYFLTSLFGSGIGIGIIIITISSLFSEQFPQQYRGGALVFFGFISIVGKMLAVLFTYVYDSENWMFSQYFMIGLGVAGLVLARWKIPESVRFLLVKGETKKSIQIIEKLLKEQQQSDLSLSEVRNLSQWGAENKKISSNETSYREIFRENQLMKTVMLSLSWFFVNFMFYGQLFIMPFIFQNNGGLMYFMEMLCGEIPSIFLTVNMIERQRFGRKNSLIIFFVLAALLNFALIYKESIVLVALSRLTMKCIFQILYPYTAESYSTRLRSHGLAFCGGVGRMGSILMPMLIFPLYQMDSYLVFVGFMAASMIGLYSSLSGHETLNRRLDDVSIQVSMDEATALHIQEEIAPDQK